MLPSITKEIPTILKAYYLHWLSNSDSKLVTHPSQVLYFQSKLLTLEKWDLLYSMSHAELKHWSIVSTVKN